MAAENYLRKITLHSPAEIRILPAIDKESQTSPLKVRAIMQSRDGAFCCGECQGMQRAAWWPFQENPRVE
jgi:hypothetical protein